MLLCSQSWGPYFRFQWSLLLPPLKHLRCSSCTPGPADTWLEHAKSFHPPSQEKPVCTWIFFTSVFCWVSVNKMIFVKQIFLNCGPGNLVHLTCTRDSFKIIGSIWTSLTISYTVVLILKKKICQVSGSKYFHFTAQGLSVVRYHILMWFLLSVAFSKWSTAQLKLNTLNAGVFSHSRSRFSARGGWVGGWEHSYLRSQLRAQICLQ